MDSNLVDRDAEHLKLLSIFHYVLAGLKALISLVFIFHIFMGIVFIVAGTQSRGGGPPAFLGGIFIVLGMFAMALGLVGAGLLAFAGRFLAQRRHYTYCFVIAVLSCLSFPLGTVLGVFTLVVLSRSSVKASFEAGAPPA